MNIIIFDDYTRRQLLPFTFTRPIAGIRVGILTIRQKWEKYFEQPSCTLSADYLRKKFPLHIGNENLFINGSVLPNAKLVEQINNLKPGQAIVDGKIAIAVRISGKKPPLLHKANGEWEPLVDEHECQQPNTNYVKISYLWEIFSENGQALKADFDLLTQNRQSQPLSNTNTVIGDPQLIFLEEGAKVEGAFLNTTNGPIYVGKHAEIMEGSMIRGPFALCKHSTVKMGAKIYGATTIGPYSKVGGEISNSVIFGYSNKAHDGFLGNSVLGEWCNLGADTNNSNLKNNYSEVSIWDYTQKKYINSGLRFCGLFMGDHSKSGINTMFNTGTIVGICANIFGTGYPLKYIPSFSWGGADKGFITHNLKKALETAIEVYARRGKLFDHTEAELLRDVHKMTKAYRIDNNITRFLKSVSSCA
ncbi:MAG: GlmU family protein [Sphingobacteriales bacterium]|nr:GlmU family protein [Sphingobacteriales bacterium]